ncbi:ATP-binding cassette domain-containing protein [Rhizobium leguminosarum]|uniref:oligopeptide/dipeptide ABC transporter ATP-binding protein n=1 Tax=Rhizobium leguminosarum TaxID=384 RepID=UPI001C9456C5|nr:ATP-binding cassette domain-containing protein [Rhizobium leguminosarum]
MELLETTGLTCDYLIRDRFGRRTRPLRALDGISLTVARGEVLGIVGETGCGKSTLAKAIAGIRVPTAGSVILSGRIIASAQLKPSKSDRARLQYVYQDPGASLDPRWTLRRSLHEPLIIHTSFGFAEREARVLKVINALDLSPELMARYPHELSGGQQRRMGLARILVLTPEVVLFDEPTSGLDVVVQSSVLALLRDLRREFELSYLLISHDIAVVSAMCDRVAVMYRGRLVEIGPTENVMKRPLHPYTRSLLGATLRIGTLRLTDNVVIPNMAGPATIDKGCSFRPHCPAVVPSCSSVDPCLYFEGRHGAACLHVGGRSSSTS